MAISFRHRAGPLLSQLLEAQAQEARAVAYPELEHVAAALVERADELGDAVVWPVGPAAERIAGAATLLASGRLQVATWNTALTGQRVLLVAAVGTTPLSMVAATEHVRRLGAAEVHACAVDVAGAEDEACWATFAVLAAPAPQVRRAAVAAAL